MKKKKEEKYVHELLEPVKEYIKKFTDDLLEEAKKSDDLERSIAILMYATAVKSFTSRTGYWRKYIVQTTKLLKAKSKRDKEDGNEKD